MNSAGACPPHLPRRVFIPTKRQSREQFAVAIVVDDHHFRVLDGTELSLHARTSTTPIRNFNAHRPRKRKPCVDNDASHMSGDHTGQLIATLHRGVPRGRAHARAGYHSGYPLEQRGLRDGSVVVANAVAVDPHRYLAGRFSRQLMKITNYRSLVWLPGPGQEGQPPALTGKHAESPVSSSLRRCSTTR